MTGNKQRRVGIMGGTFDPIHIGHLILGENAWKQFGLDTVLFMPSANPPHKRERTGIAEVKDRIAMVQLAIEGNSHFELSLEEAFMEDYCYTKETLERLKASHPDTEYYFIMGADSLFAFETWKNPEEICKLCVIVAAVRDHVPNERFQEQINYLTQKYHAQIITLTTPNIDISSHDIRYWITSGDISLRYYVPDKVIQYIISQNLYSECEATEQNCSLIPDLSRSKCGTRGTVEQNCSPIPDLSRSKCGTRGTVEQNCSPIPDLSRSKCGMRGNR